MFEMIGSYESRKVERFEDDDLFVSTCMVADSEHPYETAVSHPKYNDGKLVVVAEYDSIEDARESHLKWVELMTADELPTTLTDISSAIAFGIMSKKEIIGDQTYERGI